MKPIDGTSDFSGVALRERKTALAAIKTLVDTGWIAALDTGA